MHTLFLEFLPHREGRGMEAQPFVISSNPACPDIPDLAEQLVLAPRVGIPGLLPDLSRRLSCECHCRDLVQGQDSVGRFAGSQGRGGDMTDGVEVVTNTGVAQGTEDSLPVFALLSSGRSTANLHLVGERQEDAGARGGLSVVGALCR